MEAVSSLGEGLKRLMGLVMYVGFMSMYTRSYKSPRISHKYFYPTYNLQVGIMDLGSFLK